MTTERLEDAQDDKPASVMKTKTRNISPENWRQQGFSTQQPESTQKFRIGHAHPEQASQNCTELKHVILIAFKRVTDSK